MPQPSYALSTAVFSDGFENPTGASNIQTLFRSIGTDATGTLAAWTLTGPLPTIASNIVTFNGSGSLILGGHPDWTDMTATVRINAFQTGAGGEIDLRIHNDATATNWVGGQVAAGILVLGKVVGGVFASVTNTAIALVNGNSYWLRVQAVGTTYTVTLFNDSAGAIGSQVATLTGTVTDASVQSGQVVVTAASLAEQVGGAFANVLTVTGPAPSGWTPSATWTTEEPAFCWSKIAAYAGSYSLSINLKSGASGDSQWIGPTLQSALSLAASAYIKATGTVVAQFEGYGYGVTAAPADDGAWHQSVGTFFNAGAPGDFYRLVINSGSGTAYFDAISVTASGPGRLVCKFGGQPLPVVGTTMAYLDLNDKTNWRMTRQTIKEVHIRLHAQRPFQSKAVPMSSNTGPKIIQLESIFDEGGGSTLATQKALLSQSDQQFLTFDNLTGVLVKLIAFGDPKPLNTIPGAYLWDLSIQFLALEPWAQDLALTTVPAFAVAGAVSPGTATDFTVTYAGSVKTRPAFTFTVGAGNAAPISQIKLQSTTSGEITTVTFATPLAAGVAWTITIDSDGWHITDQNGLEYDQAGNGWPKLYGPAGQVNSFVFTVVTSSGVLSAATLALSYLNRWEL